MKYLITFLFVCSASTAFSQYFTVRYSDDFKTTEGRTKNRVIEGSVYHNGFFYTAVNNKPIGMGKWVFTKVFDLKQPIQLRKSDINMNQVGELSLEGGAKAFAPISPILIQFNGRLLVGYYKPNNKERFDYYLGVVNEESLQVSDETIVFSIPMENAGLGKMQKLMDRAAAFNVSVSPDDSQLLVSVMKDETTLMVKVLSKELKVERKYESKLKGNKLANLYRSLLAADKSIFCVLSTGNDNMSVLVIDSTGKKQELKTTDFIPGRFVRNLFFQRSKAGDAVYFYTTFYSGKEDSANCSGFFVGSYDLQKQQLSKKAEYLFDAKQLAEMLERAPNKKGEKPEMEKRFFSVLTEGDNGALVFSGSSKNVGYASTTYNGKTTLWTSAHIGSVYSFFLGKELTVESYVVLPRKILFTSADRGGGSHASILASDLYSIRVFPKGDGLVLVYNDYILNLKQPLDKPAYSSNTSNNLVLAEAEIHRDGKIVYRNQITDDQKGAFTIRLSEALTNKATNSLFAPIGKTGFGFNNGKDIYIRWCILEPAH